MPAFAPLKIGMDILLREEHIKTDVLIAQGGLFKTPVVAQQALADALDTPITVMENAGEGGPWGMAVLALYDLILRLPPLPIRWSGSNQLSNRA